MPITILNYLLHKNKFIFVDGFPHTKNFGDALGTPIVEYLSEKKILPSKNVSRILFAVLGFKNYAVIGSILQWIKKGSAVWGAGFIDDNQKFIKPGKIYAVRGPKTRKIYVDKGLNCPNIYGDPALLLPLIYYPEIKKTYRYGIIPHYADSNHPWIIEMTKRNNILIIDLMVYTDYKTIVDQMLSCENILSSSLHGIIISDAYKIPNLHIKLSDKVVGGSFKFEDYYLSVRKKIRKVVKPANLNIEDLEFVKDQVQIDLKKLLEVCPFITPAKKDFLINLLENDNRFSHLNS